MSKSLSETQSHYTIYDRELLAIILALREWRHYLLGATTPFTILSDHNNLRFPRKPQELTDRQIRWNVFLSKFNFNIEYRKGSKNQKADILSRRPDHRVNAISTSITNEDFIEKIKNNYNNDKEISDLINKINNNFDSNYFISNDLIFYNDRLFVPSALRKALFEQYHSSPVAGHFGFDKTKELISRSYFWPKMRHDIYFWIKQCSTCATMKNSTHLPYGLVQVSDTPVRPWDIISVDFITDLPKSSNYTTIVNIVDNFSKMVHLIPFAGLPNAEDTANLFLSNIFRLHGLPSVIVSDRGTQFTSSFWRNLLKNLGIQFKFSTAHHHASNGQVERLNGVVMQVLRCITSDNPELWAYYLPMVEFSINNSFNSSTNKTPFEIIYGYNLSFDPISKITTPKNKADLTSFDWNYHFTIIKNLLEKSKIENKLVADKNKNEGPKFKVNDLVWLNVIPSTKKLGKFAARRTGPFKILEIISPVTYKIDIPPTSRQSPIVHVERLEKYY